MKILTYDNLNDAYMEVNRKVLMEPNTMINYLENTRGVIEDLVIRVTSTKCDQINLGALGYKKGKWGHLLRTYYDKPSFVKFLADCGTSRGVSIAYDFKRKDTGNGSCMREVIVTRPSRNKKWNKVTIIWRATELQKRFAADLIFVHRLVEAIPNADIKEIQLYIVSAYQSGMYVIPLVEPLFKVKMETLDPTSHRYLKIIRERHMKYYQNGSPVQKLSPAKIMQDVAEAHRTGEKLPFIGYEDCILEV